jgi:hypothetical protein
MWERTWLLQCASKVSDELEMLDLDQDLERPLINLSMVNGFSKL